MNNLFGGRTKIKKTPTVSVIKISKRSERLENRTRVLLFDLVDFRIRSGRVYCYVLFTQMFLFSVFSTHSFYVRRVLHGSLENSYCARTQRRNKTFR